MDWIIQERNSDVLRGLIVTAAEEGRIDLLDEVWDSVDDEDDNEYIFRRVDSSTARHSKLNVLKWHETKGLSIDKDYCACEAVKYGQLHILKWLREEKGLEFHFSMFELSADGGQLHVMKWLREQGCPWTYYTFYFAAKAGNWKSSNGFTMKAVLGLRMSMILILY